jgi:hypothetical protein
MTENTSIRPNVVALFLDLNLGDNPNTWTHTDGRPITRDELHLAMTATREELEAVLEHSTRSLDYAREQETATKRFLELTAPYFAAHPGASVADIRPLMTSEDRAEFDQLAELLAPDGTLVWQTQN